MTCISQMKTNLGMASTSVGWATRLKNSFSGIDGLLETFIDAKGSNRTCAYDDGIELNRTLDEINLLISEPKLGDVGYKFCKIFRGGGVFNGSVESVRDDGRRFVVYDDKATALMTMAELRKLDAKQHNTEGTVAIVDGDNEVVLTVMAISRLILQRALQQYQRTDG
jgi:hypothetical protein